MKNTLSSLYHCSFIFSFNDDPPPPLSPGLQKIYQIKSIISCKIVWLFCFPFHRDLISFCEINKKKVCSKKKQHSIKFTCPCEWRSPFEFSIKGINHMLQENEIQKHVWYVSLINFVIIISVFIRKQKKILINILISSICQKIK